MQFESKYMPIKQVYRLFLLQISQFNPYAAGTVYMRFQANVEPNKLTPNR